MKVRGQSEGAFGAIEGSELRRLGRFAGALMIVGALVSVPAGLVLEPMPEATNHLIGLATLLTGLAAWFAPWEEMSPNWLHAAMVVATVEIAAGVVVFSDDYAFFYVLVAMYAAFVVRDRNVLVAYMSLLAVALFAPLSYDDEDLKEQAHHILVTLPVLAIAAFLVRYLRDTLEDREDQYRGFAYEAVSLAERIRGHPERSDADEDLEARLGRLAAGAPPDGGRDG